MVCALFFVFLLDMLVPSMSCFACAAGSLINSSTYWVESLMLTSLMKHGDGGAALIAARTLLSLCTLCSCPPLSSLTLPLATGVELVRKNKPFLQVCLMPCVTASQCT